MASKISKKKTLKIKAILNIDENSKVITLEVEDVDTPMNLADLALEMKFNGEEVDISFVQSEDIA